MRIFITLAAAVSATTAQAHPGHLADIAGHDHWLGAAAIGAAIAIGLWNAAKARKDKADVETPDETDAEAQEA